jgi:phage terminase large subunit-like protein
MQNKNRVTLVADTMVLQKEMERRIGYKFNRYYPDTGPLRRELYYRSLEFFRAGLVYPERLKLGGNRTGKTQSAAYEVACHTTGLYPDWWEGRTFDTAIECWCAGDTATTTRDIAQLELYGPYRDAPKTGFVPAHLIKHQAMKNAVPNAIETMWVQHVSGAQSTIGFKSYDQKREAFQGTAKHLIWLDEECPEDVYTECLLRTLTVKGIVMVTFTPVEGLTVFLQNWLDTAVCFESHDSDVIIPAEEAVLGSADKASDLTPEDRGEITGGPAKDLTIRTRHITMVGWDEVPHLDEQAQQMMLQSIPAYQRAARTKGVPHLGSGVIYPVVEDEFKVKPFEIPAHWPKGYGMDVGWNWTVAVWGAYDRETATWYLYREHARSHAEPPVHAEGINAPGRWIPGRIDPAANGRSQADGKQLFQLYKDLGLNLDIAPNSVEAGIYEIWTLLTAGRIKVFSNLRHWFIEYRMYRRDEKGRVVKKNDHLMDASRYLIHSGINWLQVGPDAGKLIRATGGAGADWADRFSRNTDGHGSWMS